MKKNPGAMFVWGIGPAPGVHLIIGKVPERDEPDTFGHLGFTYVLDPKGSLLRVPNENFRDYIKLILNC